MPSPPPSPSASSRPIASWGTHVVVALALITGILQISLGVLTYELLTGELPFGRGPLLDIAQRQQRTDTATRLAERGVTAGVSSAIGWALKAEPADRPRSAGEFARALDAGLTAMMGSGVEAKT